MSSASKLRFHRTTRIRTNDVNKIQIMYTYLQHGNLSWYTYLETLDERTNKSQQTDLDKMYFRWVWSIDDELINWIITAGLYADEMWVFTYTSWVHSFRIGITIQSILYNAKWDRTVPEYKNFDPRRFAHRLHFPFRSSCVVTEWERNDGHLYAHIRANNT